MLTFDFSDFERKVRSIESGARQVPFVMAYAVTKAMQEARARETDTMRAVFDRPTRYTLNALQVLPATKHSLRAERFKEFGGTPAWKYLGPEVVGGRTSEKGFERALQSAGILLGDESLPASTSLPTWTADFPTHLLQSSRSAHGHSQTFR